MGRLFMRSKSKELMIKIRDYAEQFTLEHSRTPSTAEIGEALGISKATAFNYLKAMHDQGMVYYADGILNTRVTNKMRLQTMNIPVVKDIPCGAFKEYLKNTEEYITFPKCLLGKGEFYILRASDDSMVDAGIDIGDLVFINMKRKAKSGDIVVAFINGSVFLKRFMIDKSSNNGLLLSENNKKDYAPIEESAGKIKGVAIKVMKNL